MERIEKTKSRLKKLDSLVKDHLDKIKQAKEDFSSPKPHFLDELKNKTPLERRKMFKEIGNRILMYASDEYDSASYADYQDINLTIKQIRDLNLNLTPESLLEEDTHESINDYISLLKEHLLIRGEQIDDLKNTISFGMMDTKQIEEALGYGLEDVFKGLFGDAYLSEQKEDAKKTYEEFKDSARTFFQNLKIYERNARGINKLNKQLMDLLEIGEKFHEGGSDPDSLREEFEKVKKRKLN